MENFYKLIFRGIKTIYLILSSLMHFVHSEHNLQGVAQSYQGAFTIIVFSGFSGC